MPSILAPLLAIVLVRFSVAHTEWQTITSKFGASLTLPADLALAPSPVAEKADQKSAPVLSISERYVSADQISGVCITKKPIPADEDASDSEASKMEDVVFTQTNLEQDKASRIDYGAKQGWPILDLDIVPDVKEKFLVGDGASLPVTADTGFVHYRVLRTKTDYYEIDIYGKLSVEDRGKILDGFTLPADVGVGKLSKWGPDPKNQSLDEGKVGIWTPIEFTEDKIDNSDPDKVAEYKSYSAEFGYVSLSIAVVPLPKGASEHIDDAALDELLEVQTKALIDEDSLPKATFSESESNVTKLDTFRYRTYRDGTAEGRIDASVKNDTLFIFRISVPHGLLESDDIKRMVASYSVL